MKFDLEKPIEIVASEDGNLRASQVPVGNPLLFYGVLTRALAIVNGWPDPDPTLPQFAACTVTIGCVNGVVTVESANPSKVAVLGTIYSAFSASMSQFMQHAARQAAVDAAAMEQIMKGRPDYHAHKSVQTR